MWRSKRKERRERYELMRLVLKDTINALDKAEMVRLDFYERWRDLRSENYRLQTENERLRSVLERMDDRKNPMMPRSVMARLAKETLDSLRDLTLEESASYEASLDRMFTKPAGNFFDDLEVSKDESK